MMVGESATHQGLNSSQPPLNALGSNMTMNWKITPKPNRAPQAARRPRVLFFAEAVTLAHVARPVTLAQSLDPRQYDVHLAWDDRYASLFPDLSLRTHALHSIPSQQFLRSLAAGRPIYRCEELRRYVRQDAKLIQAIEPDAIVGDFRLSLSISAIKAKVPYLAIANAYWSPFARTRHPRYPMPDHPINRIVGRRLGGWLFNKIRPLIFSRYAAPINRLRVEHGLPSLGNDLRHVYTHGDQTLYADLPTLGNIEELPDHHHFIGPVHWSPRIALPRWWNDIPPEKPVIYVNLGSSGQPRRLPSLLGALGALDATIIAATAGAAPPTSMPANIHLAGYLPGDAACERASLIICNGGSPATQQALLAGKPALGLPGNLDQHLNMRQITRMGAGRSLLSEHCKPPMIQETVRSMLDDAVMSQTARQLAERMRASDSGAAFRKCLDRALGTCPANEPIRTEDGRDGVSPWETAEELQLAAAASGDES